MAATTELGTTDDSNFEQRYNEINSFSLNEQLSFANDHCGTIRNRNSLSSGQNCSEGSTSVGFLQPNTPRLR